MLPWYKTGVMKMRKNYFAKIVKYMKKAALYYPR